jgi:UrcA family protein
MSDPKHQGRIMHTGIVRNPARLAMLLAAAGLAFVSSVSAKEPPSIRVPISDLNLASTDGQRALEHRVFSAIRTVCAPQTPSVSATTSVARVQVAYCRRAALASVQRQLDQRGLPKLYVADRN